jgi:16S rRNA (guanine527-N7)-methyltransferase
MTSRDILTAGAGELGFSLTDKQVDALLLLLSELAKWNKKINLTSITSERDMIIKHVLDSLLYIRGFGPALPKQLLDMGSGAGFPAFPIKLYCPDMKLTLVESVKKKASFLRHIVRLLGLQGIEVMDKRLEELPTSCLQAYDAVTARAFADMPKALAAAAPLLASGGLLVLSRGSEENIVDADVQRYGYVQDNRIEISLPFSDFKRAIWTFNKR